MVLHISSPSSWKAVAIGTRSNRMFQEAWGQHGKTGLDEKPIPNSPRRNWEATGRLLFSVDFFRSLASCTICCLMPALSMFPAYCYTSAKWSNNWCETVCSIKQSKISESPALLFHQSPKERIWGRRCCRAGAERLRSGWVTLLENQSISN